MRRPLEREDRDRDLAGNIDLLTTLGSLDSYSNSKSRFLKFLKW